MYNIYYVLRKVTIRKYVWRLCTGIMSPHKVPLEALREREREGVEVDCVWNVMAHAQKPDFVFRRNERVHLNRRGHQFSRIVTAEVCASAVVMLDTPCCEVVWRVLATHSIRQVPVHFPSRVSPCAITCQLDSTDILVLKSGARCGGWSTLPESFTPGRETQYQLYLTQGGPQDWSGRVWRRENLLPKPWFTPQPVRPVAIRSTALSRLPLHRYCHKISFQNVFT